MAGTKHLEQVPHLVGCCKPCRRFGDCNPGGGGLISLQGCDAGGKPHGGKEASLVDQRVNRGTAMPETGCEGGKIDMSRDIGLARTVQQTGPAMAGDRLERVACRRFRMAIVDDKGE